MSEENNLITVTIGEDRIEFDPEVLREYLVEAVGYLAAIDEPKEDLKAVIEAAAGATKLPKKVVSKYFKARYKAETAAQKAQGDLFAQLDEAVDGN